MADNRQVQQRTAKGLEIPVPKRSEFMRDREKVAGPEKKPNPEPLTGKPGRPRKNLD
jgi:hypothetical protein